MTAQLCMLRPEDRIASDPAVIARIRRDNPRDGDQMLRRGFSALAITVSTLCEHVENRDMAGVPAQLRSLQRMASDLGQTTLAEVAGGAHESLAGGDDTAFAALWSRLLRIVSQGLAGGAPPMGRSL